MTRVMSSMAEIIRVGGWGLRGLGYPFGIAERAVPLLAWTEAATGAAIRSIRLSEDEIVASHTAPRLNQSPGTDGERRLSAHGQHLLEVGPPAADLVTADARRHGTAALTLDGSIGSAFAPVLANMLAHRKLSGVLIFRSRPTTGEIGWLPFTQGFVTASMTLDGNDMAVPTWLERAAPMDSSKMSKLREMLDRQIHAAREAEFGHLSFIAWQCEVPPIMGPMENLCSRVTEAWRTGVETTEEDLRYLYQLETRAWAPTSERSRSQAGYGKF